MPKIFISYRRADSSAVSGRIYDRLVAAFGREQVFKDVDAIDLGEHYADRLRHEIYQCDVVLVIIGPKWISIRQNDGDRRIDDPADPVRIEIETALQRKDRLLIIPLLVDNVTMPDAEEFPESIRELHFINGQQVRNDPDFHRDMDTLIAKIKRRFGDEETLTGTIVRPQATLAKTGGPRGGSCRSRVLSSRQSPYWLLVARPAPSSTLLHRPPRPPKPHHPQPHTRPRSLRRSPSRGRHWWRALGRGAIIPN